MQEMQEMRVWSLVWEDSPGGGNGDPFQYSCLENSMYGRAWWATVHRVAKSQTWLRDWAHTFSIGVNFLDKSYRPQSTGKNSSVHGILQARILEWAAIFFSRDLPNPGIEPGSPALQADSLPSEPPGKSTGKETPIQRQFILSYCKWC